MIIMSHGTGYSQGMKKTDMAIPLDPSPGSRRNTISALFQQYIWLFKEMQYHPKKTKKQQTALLPPRVLKALLKVEISCCRLLLIKV